MERTIRQTPAPKHQPSANDGSQLEDEEDIPRSLLIILILLF